MRSFVFAFFALFSVMLFGQATAIHCDGQPVAADESPLSSKIELKTMEGKSTTLSEFRGTPVILNFWATWCPPCKRELPWLSAIDKKYRNQGLKVVGVSMDEFNDPAVAKITAEAGVQYQLLFGNLEDSLELLGAQGLPVTLYIDRDGKLRHRMQGIANQQELEKFAQELVK